jgi:hypothetical protein
MSSVITTSNPVSPSAAKSKLRQLAGGCNPQAERIENINKRERN